MTDNIPPSPAEIEALAEEMVLCKARIADIQDKAETDCKPHVDRLGELKTAAEKWIRRFGSAHAEKSKILHGLLYEIMGTFGMSILVDGAAVESFRLALAKAKLAKLLKRLFIKTTRYELNPDAADILKGTELKPKLAALWARCMVPMPKTPVITPRLKKKEQENAA